MNMDLSLCASEAWGMELSCFGVSFTKKQLNGKDSQALLFKGHAATGLSLFVFTFLVFSLRSAADDWWELLRATDKELLISPPLREGLLSPDLCHWCCTLGPILRALSCFPEHIYFMFRSLWRPNHQDGAIRFNTIQSTLFTWHICGALMKFKSMGTATTFVFKTGVKNWWGVSLSACVLAVQPLSSLV